MRLLWLPRAVGSGVAWVLYLAIALMLWPFIGRGIRRGGQ
jgi:hypothetical protein